MTMWTIGSLAREAGVRASTLRYYEREGLITPAGRSDGNYRLYARDGLERLRFIRSAQASGFTIADIKTLLAYRDGIIAPCREIRRLIEDRRSHIRRRIEELHQIQRILDFYLAECQRAEQDATCNVMRKLESDFRRGSRPPAHGQKSSHRS